MENRQASAVDKEHDEIDIIMDSGASEYDVTNENT